MINTDSAPNSERVQVQPKYKQIRQQFGLNYMNSVLACQILRLLGNGESQTETAKKVGKRKSVINFYASKFLSDSLLVIDKKSKPIIYSLTPYGTKIITTCDLAHPKPYLFESYALKFRLVENRFRYDCRDCREKNCDLRKDGLTNLCSRMWKRLGEPNNWQKFGLKYRGVSVELNLGKIPTVIIRSGQIQGTNPYEMSARAHEIIEFVRTKLLGWGIVLSEDSELVNNPNFHEVSKAPEEAFNAYGAVTTPHAQLDNSDQKEPHRESDLNGVINWLNEGHNVAQTLKEVNQLRTDFSKQLEKVDSMKAQISAVLEQLTSKTLENEQLKQLYISQAELVLRLEKSNGELTNAVSRLLNALTNSSQQKFDSKDNESSKGEIKPMPDFYTK